MIDLFNNFRAYTSYGTIHTMLSYRHAFHAGNHADVLKHWVQVMILQSLVQKDKPFLYFETHGGAGAYSLTSDMSQKGGEYKTGVNKIIKSSAPPEEIKEYLNIVKSASEQQTYLGSPGIAQQVMRSQDKAILCELHPVDFSILSGFIGRDPRFYVSNKDGYKVLKASLPHPIRRGLVLIDPSYELKEDYQKMGERLGDGLKRCSTLTYAIWYPIVDKKNVENLINSIKKTRAQKLLKIELSIQSESRALSEKGKGMTGSGMLIVNPPWQLENKANKVLPWLVEVLSTEGGGYLIDNVLSLKH